MSTTAILIVDDEKSIRLTVSQSLASPGTTVETAVNGEEALEKVATNAYDLVLLDLRLPGMDGLEVLRRLRERYPKLPVLLLTAHGTIEHAVEAMKLGAVDFIQKPFAPRELREAVALALTSRSRSNSEGEAPTQMNGAGPG